MHKYWFLQLSSRRNLLHYQPSYYTIWLMRYFSQFIVIFHAVKRPRPFSGSISIWFSAWPWSCSWPYFWKTITSSLVIGKNSEYFVDISLYRKSESLTKVFPTSNWSEKFQWSYLPKWSCFGRSFRRCIKVNYFWTVILRLIVWVRNIFQLFDTRVTIFSRWPRSTLSACIPWVLWKLSKTGIWSWKTK